MSACCVAVTHQGVPCLRLSLAQGDVALISLHGGQVVSWVSGGQERLYLSPRSLWDGHSAIRGGVPVCFPQFNQRGTLPKHGFARNRLWRASGGGESGGMVDQALCRLELASDAASLALWPQAFEVQLTVTLSPGTLRVALDVRNTGEGPLTFTGALHTYLAVDDVANARLQGLGGQPEWNAVTDVHGHASGDVQFDGEFDRVYQASPRHLTLREVGRQLHLTQSPSFDQTVVWNPGARLCAQLVDMPPDGYRHMLCVEAACVDTAASVAPGDVWHGWQQFTLD